MMAASRSSAAGDETAQCRLRVLGRLLGTAR